MRNLLNVGYQCETKPGNDALPPSESAWDTTRNSLIYASGPTEAHAVIEVKRISESGTSSLSRTTVLEDITSWDAPCPLPGLVNDEILLLHYFPESSTACLVLAGGDIVVVRETPSDDEEKIEIVGSVEVGIAAAAWSPDEELLAIVTNADTLLYMTRNFDNVNNAALTAADLDASKHVSVGWGKRETQFQGKRAKALRDPTIPEFVDDGTLSPNDDKKIAITWRGDGACVAINSIVSDQRRAIRVFDREGNLDSVSEPVTGLESALSWRPAGNVIAGVQRRTDRIEVIFFERNGLRHGQFSLRLKPAELETWASSISLSWNADSTVLAVTYKDRVQLWTMGNYHYYLKQEIVFEGPDVGPVSVQWHPMDTLRLSILHGHDIHILDYVFEVSHGSSVPPNDLGSVAVIDGRTLKITPLKQTGIPPPMALFELEVDEPIIDCAFSASNSVIGTLTRRGIYLFKWNHESRNLPPQQVDFLEFKDQHRRLFHRQLVFTLEDRLITVGHDLEDHKTDILLHAQVEAGDTTWTFYDRSPVTGHFVRFSTDSANAFVWYETSKHVDMIDGQTVNRDCDSYRKVADGNPWSSYTIPHTQERSDGEVSHSPKGCIRFSMSKDGKLFADSRLLAANCTSFVVSEAHLLFTTSQHLLKFVHLMQVDDLAVPRDTPEIDERCRAVERGARIVTVSPSSYAVVLQMPRGNLETIYPRALVLAGIRKHIDQMQYSSAYLACQGHQVDTNILCDYRPDQFITNVPEILAQLKKPSRIDDFLSKLKDEDVSSTLYKDTLTTQKSENLPGTAEKRVINGSISREQEQWSLSKVNSICDAFLAALSPTSPGQIQNIITAHVSKRPPNLIAALQIVSELRTASPEKAESAIVHLCFLADINRLYDSALSIYNMPLTLLVAEQSQKDPREYVPFLEHLHELPQEQRRRFEIDDYLGNHAKALTALYELSAHAELERYCVRHALYSQAVGLYQHEPTPRTHFKKLTRLFAEHLASNSKNRHAAMLFESLLDYSAAYPLYALAHMWRESLATAMLTPLSDDQLRSHALSLANALSETDHDFRAAATIHSDHLGDHLTAARLLCKGSYFGDATRLLAHHQLTDQMEATLDIGITEKLGEILELLADCKSQLAAQVTRIEELRVKKAEDPLAFYGGETTVDGVRALDIPDNVSIAPTDASTTGGQSLFTRYGSTKGAGTVLSTASRKTSKTRRKEERKRAMGKKGSVYEEEYLVASVRRCIERVHGALEEIRRLAEGLIRRAMGDRAGVVENTVQELLRQCAEAVHRIWPEQSQGRGGPIGAHKDHIDDRGRPSGADGVLWDSQTEAASPHQDPPMIPVWRVLGG